MDKINKMINSEINYLHVKTATTYITMPTSLNYSISSEIESTEKSLNQRNPILLIILRIVPIT